MFQARGPVLLLIFNGTGLKEESNEDSWAADMMEEKSTAGTIDRIL
jgi:hypothetical protein